MHYLFHQSQVLVFRLRTSCWAFNHWWSGCKIISKCQGTCDPKIERNAKGDSNWTINQSYGSHYLLFDFSWTYCEMSFPRNGKTHGTHHFLCIFNFYLFMWIKDHDILLHATHSWEGDKHYATIHLTILKLVGKLYLVVTQLATHLKEAIHQVMGYSWLSNLHASIMTIDSILTRVNVFDQLTWTMETFIY